MKYTKNTIIKRVTPRVFKLALPSVLTFCLFILSGCLNHQSRWTGGLGVTLAQIEDGVVIKHIAPSFQSEDDALLPGDQIVEVDGKDVSAWPKEAILEEISGPVGGTVSIGVLRDNQVVTFEIERIMLKKASSKTLHSVKKGSAPQVAPETDTAQNAEENAPERTSEWKADTADENSETPGATDTDAADPTSNESVEDDADTENGTVENEPTDSESTDTSAPASATP